MSSVTPVTHNGQTYALFVCGRPEINDAQFFTQNQDEFQVGIFERGAGYEVKAHQHPDLPRNLIHTSEFLYVEAGSADVTVFDEEWKELHKQAVKAGDFLVFFRGGHQLTMLEKTRLIEVKQGPFPGQEKAKVFKN
jgi:mannose-6-phosphate isomerase-like protein (cupin superfamily)